MKKAQILTKGHRQSDQPGKPGPAQARASGQGPTHPSPPALPAALLAQTVEIWASWIQPDSWLLPAHLSTAGPACFPSVLLSFPSAWDSSHENHQQNKQQSQGRSLTYIKKQVILVNYVGTTRVCVFHGGWGEMHAQSPTGRPQPKLYFQAAYPAVKHHQESQPRETVPYNPLYGWIKSHVNETYKMAKRGKKQHL